MAEERKARLVAIIGSAIFLVLAPGTVAVYLPWTLTRWQMQPPLSGLAPMRIAGGVLLAAGSIGLLDSFRRFAVQGLGTVVTGLYRFVRNPMYCGVVAAIAGQALLFGSTRLIIYAAAVWLAFHLFVLLYEEPRLRSVYGAGYEEFRTSVPRWIPRLTPWHGGRDRGT